MRAAAVRLAASCCPSTGFAAESTYAVAAAAAAAAYSAALRDGAADIDCETAPTARVRPYFDRTPDSKHTPLVAAIGRQRVDGFGLLGAMSKKRPRVRAVGKKAAATQSARVVTVHN